MDDFIGYDHIGEERFVEVSLQAHNFGAVACLLKDRRHNFIGDNRLEPAMPEFSKVDNISDEIKVFRFFCLKVVQGVLALQVTVTKMGVGNPYTVKV